MTAAYWVDGVLINTGRSLTADQLTSAMDNMGVEQVVNAYSNEDQIGADADVQERFHCPVEGREGGAKPLQLKSGLSLGSCTRAIRLSSYVKPSRIPLDN